MLPSYVDDAIVEAMATHVAKQVESGVAAMLWAGFLVKPEKVEVSE